VVDHVAPGRQRPLSQQPVGDVGPPGLAEHREELAVGNVILLRPGVWHGYEDCDRLELYNCCFSSELLRRELAGAQEDPLLSFLLWNGPCATSEHGVLSFRLTGPVLAECATHLEALAELRLSSPAQYRGDVLGRLSLVLSQLARQAQGSWALVGPDGPPHPAVRRAMRMLESDIARGWTLGQLADDLHLAPAYLVRLFRGTTGLPPMAYLARLRAERAAVLMLHSDEPITSIGRTVGWSDQNYFARRFKAHYGLSATVYQKRFAPKASHLARFSG
jgi:AraC family transcriptional regulator, L-rhamnose operon transcriptional activator RhaR